MNNRYARPKIWRIFWQISLIVALIGLLVTPGQPAAAAPNLALTPLTWNVVGLDSNNILVGPNNFPVGLRVCNSGPDDASNVTVQFVWDDNLNLFSGNTYINLRTGSLSSISLPTLAGSGGCHDFYFEVTVNRNSNAYDKVRRFHFLVTANGGISLTSSTPREIYVEHLISQNRNATEDVKLDGVSIPVGGTMNLMVGSTYSIKLIGHTATQGYEQLESFINFSNTIFRINSVTTTYSAHPGPETDALAYTKPYADGCRWENDPNSPYYRSCWSTGKYGGSVTLDYNVTILAGSGTSVLTSLIYDFSGSSFHYNADYSTNVRFATINSLSSVTIEKKFVPNAITPGGTSTLMITLVNPNPTPVSGVNFQDTLPNTPGAMKVAATPNKSTTGCGTPTFNPLANDTSLAFSLGSIVANSSCVIKVDVTAPAGNYTNTTGHLFVNGTIPGTGTDTGNSGTADLAAADQACTDNQTLVSWTVPNTATNLPDNGAGSPAVNNTGYAATISAQTAASTQISSGAGKGQNDSTSWLVYGLKTGNFIRFAVDTRQYSKVKMTFYLLNSGGGNGPKNLAYSYSTNGVNYSAPTAMTVPSGSSFTQETIDLTGIASTTGVTTVQIDATNANSDNTQSGLNYDEVTFTGCAATVKPTLSKVFIAATIKVGSSTRLTFTLGNNQGNSTNKTGIKFTDVLPTGLVVADIPNAGTTCTGSPTWAPAAGDTTLTFGNPAGLSLAAGASCTAYVDIKAVKAGAFTNVSGYISSTETGDNTGPSGYGSAILTAVASPKIEKSFATSPIQTGNTVTMTISLNNPNQTTLDGVGFNDALTGGLQVGSPNGLSNTCGGVTSAVAGSTTVSLSGVTLTGGSSCQLKVRIKGTAAGTIVNAVTVTSNQTGSGDTASATLEVKNPTPGISLLKQVSANLSGPWTSYIPVTVGSPVYYRFSVENTGDVPLTAINLTDDTLAVSACNTGWSGVTLPVAVAANNNHIITCILGPVAATSGRIYNTAAAHGTYNSTMYNSREAQASYATTSLTLVKSLTESYFAGAGNVLHYSYLVTNSGFAPLLGPVTILDDKIPSVSCPNVSGVGDLDNYLDAGESLTCTGSYTVLPADVTATTITNHATASADGVSSNTDSQTATFASMDFGDLPTTYHDTLWLNNGARHNLGSLKLGPTAAGKPDGTENVAANADGNDDGVAIVAGQKWSNGSSVQIDVNLQGSTVSNLAYIGIWVDWNHDGVFNPATDFFNCSNQAVPSTASCSITVPGVGGYTVGDPLNVRIRAFDPASLPGGSLDASDSTGWANNGEVEDYQWTFAPTAVKLASLRAAQAFPWYVTPATVLGLVLVGFIAQRRKRLAKP